MRRVVSNRQLLGSEKLDVSQSVRPRMTKVREMYQVIQDDCRYKGSITVALGLNPKLEKPSVYPLHKKVTLREFYLTYEVHSFLPIYKLRMGEWEINGQLLNKGL